METLEAIKSKYSKHSEEELLGVIARLVSQVEELKTQLYYTGRERAEPEGMKPLFDEIEAASVEIEQSPSEENGPDPESDADTKPKRRGKRKPLPDHLRRVRNEIDLPEEQKFCPQHGHPLTKVGEEISEKLVVNPATVHVRQDVVFKYVCKCCETFHAPAPSPDPIPKSFASADLLAYIVTAKFVDGLPLYRQERIFQRLSIDLNRTTMSRWMIAAAVLAKPLIELMREDLLNSPVFHMDETEVQVINEANRSAQAKSYMWCMARSSERPIILFNYEQSRNKKVALDLVSEYQGTIVCDGYKVYNALAATLNCKLAGCMAHVRRKFWQAEKVAKKEVKTSKIMASEALALIKKLYKIEENIKTQPPDEILKTRQEKAVPILDDFLRWLKENEQVILPSSPTGKAIFYALSQWEKLIEYTKNPLVSIDNNYMESHIRPFVIGRNAWVFSYSPAGADASAVLYSLVETAKANAVDPHEYLSLIFKELPACDTLEKLETLLPYNAKISYPIKGYQASI